MPKSTAISLQNLIGWGKSSLFKLTIISALMIQMAYTLVSKGITYNDGVNQDILPSFFRLDGTNGLQVQLDSRQGSNIDYTISLWFRSSRTQSQLGQQSETLFQILNNFQCGFKYLNTLECRDSASSNGITLDTNGLATSTWVHLAVVGSQKAGTTYLRLDYADQVFSQTSGSYVPLNPSSTSPWNANLGINSTLQAGFVGDVREFFFSQQYVASTTIPFIKNQIMTWDPSQIAYYRLMNGNLQDSFRSLSGKFIFVNSTSQPIMMKDNRPNDMCYPFITYSQLGYLNVGIEDGTIETITLDSRYKRDQNSYAYTLSIWLQTQAGISTNASPSSGRNSAYFFSLDQSFNLWFTDDQHIAIYILGNPSYSEVYSSPVYVPIGQWVNIQIQIERVTGYTIRVYDLQRRLISSSVIQKYLPSQIPSGKALIVNNFKGYIKSIQLYQTKKDLPISGANGVTTTITDDNLILYYNFDKANYEGRNLRSLALSSSGIRGPSVYMANLATFDYKIWDDTSSFSSPSSVGTLQQSVSLFDGLACKDSNVTVRINSVSGYISTDTVKLATATAQATVELWFKRSAPSTTTNYLLSMYSTAQQSQYFAIYQDGVNGSLTCAPFPSNASMNAPKLTFAAANSQAIIVWQHVTCSFSQGGQIQGQYDNTLGTTLNYAIDISNTTTMLLAGQYKINIGNNYNGTLGSVNTFYKEVRFWTSVRYPSTINRYLYTQFDPSRDTSLVAYFRLASGSPVIYNYPSLDSGAACSTSGVDLQTESTMTVCPQYTYANMFGPGCFQNMFFKQYVHVFAEPIDQAPYVQFRLTSQYSDTVRPYQSERLSYTWSSTHQPTQELLVSSQANSETIVMPVGADGLAIDFPYTFVVSATNNKFTFYSGANQTLIPQTCRWLGDNETQQTVTDMVINEQRGASDIGFTFQINNITSTQCANSTAYLYLQDSAQLLIAPSQLGIANIIQQKVTVNNNPGYHVTIPKAEQVKFPMDTFVNLVFTLSWSNEASSAASLSQLNIAYRVKFATSVQPVISANKQLLLVGEKLTLDATQSYITGINDPTLNKLGLSYKWQCPDIFQAVCQNQTSLSTLNFPYSYFTNSSGNFTSRYTFTLAVGRSVDADPTGGKTVSVDIVWVNVAIPIFRVIANSGTSRVLATTVNDFVISLSNYDLSDSHLGYKWSFTPEIQQTFMQLSPNNSTLTLLAGGFNYNMTYILNVSVSYTDYPSSEVAHQYKFTTLTPPRPGTIFFSQTNGTALYTPFTISLTGWTSYYPPLKYKLFGMSTPSSDQFSLTSAWLNGSSSYKAILPPLSSIIVQVSDASNETYSVTQNVTIVGDPFTNWTEAIKNIINTSGTDIQLKYDTLSFLALEMNGFIEAGVPNSVTIQDRAPIFSLLQQDTSNITAGSSGQSTVLMISQAAKILPYMTSQPGLLNETLANQSSTLLKLITVPSDSYAAAMSSSEFKANYAKSLSNLMTYARVSISQGGQTSQRRLLQSNADNTSISTNSTSQNNSTTQDNSTVPITPSSTSTTDPAFNINALRNLVFNVVQYKQAFADQLCIQQAVFNVKQKVETDNYYTIIEKVPLTQTAPTQTYTDNVGNTSAIFPTADFINATTQALATAQYMCVQTTFYKVNPLMGYNYTNQSISNKAEFIQVNTMTTGYKLLEAPLQNQINSTFIAAFDYNFQDSTLNFRNNQTICMVYNYLNTNYEQSGWADGNCKTSYDMKNNQIICTCSSMSSNYYGLVTDYTRLWVREIQSDNSDEGFFAKFVNLGLAVIIFLLFFALVLPIIALCLDKKDYADLKRDTYDVSEDVMKSVAIARQQPVEEVLYRKKALAQYIDVERMSFCFVQGIIIKNLHPITGLFSRFDINVKRMIRFMMLLYQVSIIAIISAIVFSPHYRKSEAADPLRAKQIDDTDLKAALICGAVLSLLTLPWPSWLSCCLKSKLVSEANLQSTQDIKNAKAPADGQFTDIKGVSKRPHLSNRSQEDDDEAGKVYTSQRAQTVGEDAQLKGINGPNQGKAGDIEIDDPVAAVDKCIPCKVFLILLSFALCLIAVIVVGVICSKVPKSQVICIVISFYLATLGGWFVLNVLRLFFVALLASAVVDSEDENDGASTCFSSAFSCMLVNHEAKEIIRDMHAMQDIMTDEGGSAEMSPEKAKNKNSSSNTLEKLKEASPSVGNRSSQQEQQPKQVQQPVKVQQAQHQQQQQQNKPGNGRSQRYLEDNNQNQKQNNNIVKRPAYIEDSDEESQ